MLKRIYMPTYTPELILDSEVVQMKLDSQNEDRPYIEVTERQEQCLQGAVAGLTPSGNPVIPATETSTEDPGATETGALSGNPVIPATETHSLNSPDAKKFIETLSDRAQLAAILAGEKAHPQFTNGRLGVIAAIENRIKELDANG
jgi:hypothetical protein